MIEDVRYAIRSLRNRPAFTIVAVLVLAIGIGANAAIFSVANAVLLRPLPYKEPGHLIAINANYLALNMEKIGASAPEVVDYREQTQSFQDLSAFGSRDFTLTGGKGPELVSACRASASLFPLLGAAPAMGRLLSREDEQIGRDNVVVLSDGLWRRRFGGDPSVIGTSLTLDSRPYEVIGVMPAGFQFPHPSLKFGSSADLWTPLVFSEQELAHRSHYDFRVIARLKEGESISDAQAEMDALASRLQQRYPRSYRGPNGEDGGWKITATPLEDASASRVRPALLILTVAVALVLLIACANVANLLLARGLARQREAAVRLALGASRARLVRWFLTESLLLAILGGGLGLLLALWITDSLPALGLDNVPRIAEAHLDPQVLGFTSALTILTGLVFGVVPALATSGPDFATALKSQGLTAARGWQPGRLRNLIVSGEVALSVMLLIAAGLMIKSFVRLAHVDPGFDPDNLITMEVVLPQSRYAEPLKRAEFFTGLLDRVAALPSVHSAAAITILPFSNSRYDGPISVQGRNFDPSSKPLVANYRVISPGYFRAMNTPLMDGRWLTERDTVASEPVVVINQSLARLAFPDESPLGKRLKLGAPMNPRPWLSIVGVVADIKHDGLDRPTRPEMYVSYLQEPVPGLTLIARSSSDPETLAAAVRAQMLDLDRDQPIYNVRTVRQLISASVSNRRFAMVMLGAFGGVALILAIVGVYGVVAQWVGQRNREIGIRMALGADRRDIVNLVVRHGLALGGIGVVIGLAGALALTRLMAGLLYGVTIYDPFIFAATALLMTGAALAASFMPARRASRLDPLISLRCE